MSAYWSQSLAAALRASPLFLYASELKWIFVEARQKTAQGVKHRRMFRREPKGPPRGRALFSYSTHGFGGPPGAAVPSRHANIWRSVQMVETLVELGFAVDVMSLANHTDVPSGPYDLMLDIGVNLERLAPHVGERCLKIMLIDKLPLLFQNAAELERLLALQQRRGVTLPPRRFEMPNRAIECADCAISWGNEFVLEAYRFAGKPIYQVPQFGNECPWPESKDWEKCRRRFLWFGSRALVLKGLDLLLEAFAGMPELHVDVIGPVDDDPRFVRAYRRELYETPHIRAVGWVDVESQGFRELCEGAVALVYPSASEAGNSSVVQCMHAGLIPVVSRECGVDVDEFGFLLPGCSVAEIRETVRAVAHLPPAELQQRARRTWETARARHTRERFAAEFRRVIEQILAEHRR